MCIVIARGDAKGLSVCSVVVMCLGKRIMGQHHPLICILYHAYEWMMVFCYIERPYLNTRPRKLMQFPGHCCQEGGVSRGGGQHESHFNFIAYPIKEGCPRIRYIFYSSNDIVTGEQASLNCGQRASSISNKSL